MRIAIVAEVFLPKVDGVVMRTMRLINNLIEFGDEVLVICPADEGCPAQTFPVVPVRSFPFPAYPEYKIGLPNKKLVQTIEEFSPDVIHFVNPFAFGFRCYDLFSKAGINIPSVFSFHTCYGEFVKRYRLMKPLSRVLWWVMKTYHNCAHMNLTVSSAYQTELLNRGFERVECWPPAVDGTLFHPNRRSSAMRERLMGGQTNKRLFLTVSRLAPEKNIEFLADVIAQVLNACLAIVGD
ncbi:MAG: glycosyltransferase, partial [Planctomycetaceae bacterium]|nr:glycosyltransferase [Planctomycetaceae bacterium]